MTETNTTAAPEIDTETNMPDAATDIEIGLSCLASLARILAESDELDCSAFVALAQKAGAFIEQGAKAANLIDGPGICGGFDGWMTLGYR